MIFQYILEPLQLDSKRHYEWKCVSTEDRSIFCVLTPNGNRYNIYNDSYILPDSITITTLVCLKQVRFQKECQQIMQRYPMIAYFRGRFSSEDNQFIVYNPFQSLHDCVNAEYSNGELLIILQECVAWIKALELKLLRFDQDHHVQQIQSNFFSECTNCLNRCDIVGLVESFLTLGKTPSTSLANTHRNNPEVMEQTLKQSIATFEQSLKRGNHSFAGSSTNSSPKRAKFEIRDRQVCNQLCNQFLS